MDDSCGGQDMSLTDFYKSCDLDPGVILTKFLIFFSNLQSLDSYKKNSYKKRNGVVTFRTGIVPDIFSDIQSLIRDK